MKYTIISGTLGLVAVMELDGWLSAVQTLGEENQNKALNNFLTHSRRERNYRQCHLNTDE